MSFIYGLDLSMSCTGIAIFNKENLKPEAVCSVETKEKESHGMRLYKIAEKIIELKNTYEPEVIIIERAFSRFNTSTAVIYRVHGLINYLLRDYEQIYYPPKTVKEAIVRGDATKKLVQQMIGKVYPGIEFANEDESDAFAVALTYLIKNNLIQWDKAELKNLNPKRNHRTNVDESNV